jgi:hypothetical protein
LAALELFGHLQTQWRVSFGGLVGLDYNVIDRVAKWSGIPMNAARFEYLQSLEAEFLRLTHEEQEADRKKQENKRG